MKANVRWTGAVSFVGRADSGHDVPIDGSPDVGGQNRGSRPMELVLMGMGGCTAVDLVLILRKQRQDVVDCLIELDAERAPAEPKVFTRVHVHFKIIGRGLDSKKVARAIELSAEKYCSASIMIGKTAKITHDFELVEAR